jgi:hypothetical protein
MTAALLDLQEASRLAADYAIPAKRAGATEADALIARAESTGNLQILSDKRCDRDI